MAVGLTHVGPASETIWSRRRVPRLTVGAALAGAIAVAAVALLVPAQWPAISPLAPASAGASDRSDPLPAPEARVDLVDAAADVQDGVVTRLSRDGMVIARGHASGALQILDLAEGRARLLDGAGAPMTELALSTDGRSLAARDRGGALILWRSGDDEPLVLRPPAGADGCRACGAALTVAPDGDLVLAADGVGGLVVHDAETGAPRAAWRAARAAVRAAAFSADGRRIGTIDRAGGLRLWTNAGQPLWSAVAPGGAAERLALSPDGRWLALGGTGGATLWDARAGKLLHRLGGPAQTPIDLAFSADGSALGLLDADGTVEIWETATGQPRRRLAAEELPRHVTRYLFGAAPVVVGRGDWTYRVWKPV